MFIFVQEEAQVRTLSRTRAISTPLYIIRTPSIMFTLVSFGLALVEDVNHATYDRDYNNSKNDNLRKDVTTPDTKNKTEENNIAEKKRKYIPEPMQ